METKIDIYNFKKILKSAEDRLENDNIISENKSAIKEFLSTAKNGRFSSQGAGERKLASYINRLRVVNHQLGNRPFNEISEAEYEAWWQDLKDGKILNRKGQAYRTGSIRSLVNDFKTFLKWYDKGSQYYKVQWFRISSKKLGKKKRQHQNKYALSLDEIKTVLAKVQELDLKFYLALSFDSGARPEEFFNLRWKDFRYIDNPDEPSTSSYWLNIRYSKNDQMPRDIPVPLFPDIYTEYLKEYEKIGSPERPLMQFKHRYYYKKLKELVSTGTIDHEGFSHYTLRHSSWTYWSGKINDKFKLNKRMGETLTSNMADVYVNDDMLDVDYKATIKDAKKDEIKLMKEQLSALSDVVERQNRLADVIEPFLTRPDIMGQLQEFLKEQEKAEAPSHQ